MKQTHLIIISLIVIAIGVWLLWPTARAASPPGFVPVAKVADGDTIIVELNGRREAIRMIGVDTPETVDPRRPVQCFGREASKHTKRIMRGQSVRLESDSVAGDRDKYQRLLRYVHLPDGTHYNLALIRDGFGHEYTYKSQPYAHQASFKTAEREAQAAGRGFWSAATCNGNTKQLAQLIYWTG